MINSNTKDLKQIPSNIEFNTTPIPAYIKDDTMYLGTKIKINGEDKENTIGYFKYDFNNKKYEFKHKRK